MKLDLSPESWGRVILSTVLGTSICVAAAVYVDSFNFANMDDAGRVRALLTDVVLPVGLMEERSGSFLNWEGRTRSFGVVIKKPNTMSDLRVLAALADGLGRDLGVRTIDEARAELDELGAWEGNRAAAPAYTASTGAGPLSDPNTAILSTWRLHIDNARAIDGEPHLAATARRPVARLSARTAEAAGIALDGGTVIVSSSRGAVRFPTEIVADMPAGVIWLPTRAPGLGLSEHLAVSSGEVVRIEGAN